MSWGKGGIVGVNKAVWQHERTQALAAEILAHECGVKHETGSHSLCPKCAEHRELRDHGNDCVICDRPVPQCRGHRP